MRSLFYSWGGDVEDVAIWGAGVARSVAMAAMASSAVQAAIGCATSGAVLGTSSNGRRKNHVSLASSGSYSVKLQHGSRRRRLVSRNSDSSSSSPFRASNASEAVEEVTEVVKEGAEVVKETVKEAAEETVETVKEVTQGKLTRTRSFHKPRGGNIKADRLRIIMFQVPNHEIF